MVKSRFWSKQIDNMIEVNQGIKATVNELIEIAKILKIDTNNSPHNINGWR